MDTSTSIAALAAALAQFQGALEAVGKDRKGQIGAQRYVYADLPAVWDAIRAPLSKAGLSVVQPATTDGDVVSVRTVLLHASGEWMDCGACSVVVAEAPKGITLVQARGSAITYLRRYGLSSALGIVADDDDGASAGHRGGERSDAHRHDAPPVLPHAERLRRAVEWLGGQGVAMGDVEREMEAPASDWTPAHLDRLRAVVERLRGGAK